MSAVDSRLTWLLESAAILTHRQGLPVQIRRLLKEFNVDLIKEVEPKREGSGELRKLPQGNYQVVLFRANDAPRSLRPRERFTLAHELGHLLLEERYQWHPTTPADYHLREDFCNQFAAHLLIPDDQLDQFPLPSATAALGYLLHINQTCRVSLEVAARRITGHFSMIAYAMVSETKNRQGERVFVTLWGAGSIGTTFLARRKHFRQNDPLGRVLLESKIHPRHPVGFSLAQIGDGVIQPLSSGALLIAFIADQGEQAVTSCIVDGTKGSFEQRNLLPAQECRKPCAPGQVP